MFLLRILTTSLVVFNTLLFFYSSYVVVIALFSIPNKNKKKSGAVFSFPPPKNRFVFLVAARNEEKVIGNLLESLKLQHYPKELYDIIVVPNNCSDQTRLVAEKAGAKIMTCLHPVHSKGEVLNQVLPELSKPEYKYDAICVIDADNLVHADFLSAMNEAILSGAFVAQGYRDIKNPTDTPVTGAYAIYFWLISRFYNRARSNLGLSTPIGGSGFMIQTSLIRKMPDLHFMTMTEDMELTILCHLAGEKVMWVPNAVIYDEQPLSFKQSWKQRSRWSSGMYQISTIYTAPILKKAWHDKRLAGLDLISLFLSAHVQALCFIVMIIQGLIGLLQMMNHRLTPSAAWFQITSSILISWLLISAIAWITVLLEKKMQQGIWRGILYFWFFLLSWMPINLLCIFRRTITWEQIRHERNIRLQDIT